VSGPFCLQLFQVFTGAKANPKGVRTQTGANFESMANFQAFHRLPRHISFRADTLSCFHSWPGESSRYSQWVVKVAAGGCKRLAASLQKTTSKNQLRLIDRQAESSAKEVLQRKRFGSERATAAKGPLQRKTQKEVKISKSERARKSIRSESVWKAAKSPKAHGTVRNLHSTVEFRNVG